MAESGTSKLESKMPLQISRELELPDSFAGKSAFVAGTKGSGKTYTAGVIVEEMLSRDNHLIVLDPTGVWWGLRTSQNGHSAGFPIIVIGGPNGDIPLPPTSGKAIAEFVIKSGRSIVLDMSEFGSDAEQDRFVESLLTTLYREKATQRSSLHIVMDEADLFIPQMPQRGQERLIHAAKQIVLKGRSRGLGMTMITQRPQAIAKSVIEEADVVFVHRMQGLRAVKAMSAWTDLYASKDQASEFYESVPQLGDGECWVWSPRFLGEFKRVKIRKKTTFDSSRTPEPGVAIAKPTQNSHVDIDALSNALKEEIKHVEENDPKVLKKKICGLEEELRVANRANELLRNTTRTEKEFVITPEQIRAFDGLLKGVESYTKTIVEAFNKFSDDFAAKFARIAQEKIKQEGTVANGPELIRHSAIEKAAVDSDISNSAKIILAALVNFPSGAKRSRIAVFSGRSNKSSAFQMAFKELSELGYIEKHGEAYKITDVGRGLVKEPGRKTTLTEWCAKLTNQQGKIIDVLSKFYPDPLSRSALAIEIEASEKSSSFQQCFPALVDLELIESVGVGRYKLTEQLR